MTDSQVQDDLGADPNLFPKIFDDLRARQWFIKRIVAYSSNAPDIREKSKQYLEQAKTIVDTRPEPPQAREYAGFKENLEVQRVVVRTMYGAMGVHPAVFLDQDNEALLQFVVERRVRSVLQMSDYVNSDLDYFLFPSVDIWHSSLRSSAQEFWQGCQGAQNEIWPFVLSTKGKTDPAAAVASLFNVLEPTGDQDKHGVECQTAATMVLMDSLMTAADPKALLSSLDAQMDGYLAIDNPDATTRRFAVGGPLTGPPLGGFRILAEPVATGASTGLAVVPPLIEQPDFLVLLDKNGAYETVTIADFQNPSAPQETIRTSAAPIKPTTLGTVQQLTRGYGRGTRVVSTEIPLFHFLSDARPQVALFEQGFVPLDDLQPGDIFHVLGHPLIRAKIPTSAYGGERCVVVNPWEPLFRLTKVTGHGLKVSSLLDLTSAMLQVANRLLTVARKILERSLNPVLTLFPVASGVLPTPDRTNAADVALEKRVLETIGRALNVPPERWTEPDFFVGTWEVFNFLEILPKDVPWWDRRAGFRGYPKHWVLTVKGKRHLSGATDIDFQQNDLFIFGYWPANNTDLSWPKEIDKNFVGLKWGLSENIGISSTDEKRKFGIPYYDDQAGAVVAVPLFGKVPAAAAAKPTILTFDDLLPQLFSVAKDNTEAWVVRPRVTDDAGYLSHLRAIGALPAAP